MSFTSTARRGSGARCSKCSAGLPACFPTSISRAGRSRDSRRITSRDSPTAAGSGAASTRRCSPRLARPAPRARRAAPGSQAGQPPARLLDSLLRSEPEPRVSPDGRRIAYVRDEGNGASELRVRDAATFRVVARHRVTGGVDYDWVGDTLVVAQLD